MPSTPSPLSWCSPLVLPVSSSLQTFLKRIARAIGRNEMAEARRMYAAKPELQLDHLIKVRACVYACVVCFGETDRV